MSRLFSALTAGLLVLGLHCGPALATNNDGESSDGGKTGRDSLETWLADEIKLMLPNNEVERVIELFVTKLGRQQRAARLPPRPHAVLARARWRPGLASHNRLHVGHKKPSSAAGAAVCV